MNHASATDVTPRTPARANARQFLGGATAYATALAKATQTPLCTTTQRASTGWAGFEAPGDDSPPAQVRNAPADATSEMTLRIKNARFNDAA
jgi:hypothetical protein